MTGHWLVKEIIKKHGVDRYPTKEFAFMSLMEEVGELSQAVLKNKPKEDIMKEYGDVGLVLHHLGNILGLDLNYCMQKVVDEETRSFA